MNYSETLDFLYSQLPIYQRVGKVAFKKDLKNIFALSKFFNKPELKFKSIHIAGTNGKGSTANILHAIYKNNGYKVGLYTSPHLVDFRERIKINGKMISKKAVVDFVDQIKPLIKDIQPSFFEITVAMAFDYFAKENVDIAIIETGLGGRLDSTNIVIPEISVITSISMDHTDMLGDTIEKIAYEKAGIIKHNIPVVVGLLPPEAESLIKELAKERHSLYYDALRITHRFTAQGPVATDLKGNYQPLNIKTALITVDALNDTLPLDDEKTLDALKHVSEHSKLEGRWQTLSKKPLIICDVAHNEEGLMHNMVQLGEMKKQLHFILGFVNDKDMHKIIPLFPKEANYTFVKPDVIRGEDAEIIKDQFAEFGLKGKACKDLKEAVKSVKRNIKSDTSALIYIGGSNFLVADALKLKKNKEI